jgi:hypothetical protein
MKKVFTLLFISLFALTGTAQNWITTKAGGGAAMRMGTSTFETNPGAAIIGGLGYKHQLLKKLVVSGDVLIDLRLPTVVLPDGSTGAFSSTYISVPITAQYLMPLKGKDLVPYKVSTTRNTWFLEGGPYFGYGLAVSGYDPAAGAENPNNIDVGLTAGVGFNFPFENNNQFTTGMRANYGFLNTYQAYSGGPVMNNFSAVAYIGLDISLTRRKHIRHRW